MNNTTQKLEMIFNITKWQNLQEQLAQITRLAVITTDYRGIPITEHSCCRPFCRLVRSDTYLSKCCQRCDSIAGLEAVRTNRPFIYRCHFGIVDIAIPIIVDDCYVGAVMAGQVHVQDEPCGAGLEQLISSGKNSRAAQFMREHSQLYRDIPQLKSEDLLRASELLFELSNYVVSEAMLRNAKIEAGISQAEQRLFPSDSAPGPEASSPQPNLDYPVPGYAVLEPAFRYIYSHKNEAFSQKQMARLCHLSPSYFSRLWADETKESFSQYIVRLKMEWAKRLLEDTDQSVTEVSESLGFSSPGYFIKTFKKNERVTPLLYRKYCRNVKRGR